MKKEKVSPSELYAELSSMERIVQNLREKISRMEDDIEAQNTKKEHDENLLSTIGGIGEELRKNREGRHWNLYHAARKSGLRYENVQSLEEGKGSVKNLLKYCEGLGVFLQISIGSDGKVYVKTFVDRT